MRGTSDIVIAVNDERKRLGMSLKQIAGQLGIGKMTFAHWRAGRCHPNEFNAKLLEVWMDSTPEERKDLQAMGVEASRRLLDTSRARREA